jgi:hypothetical protein
MILNIKKVNATIAKKLLKNNVINRNLSPARVDHLSRQMSEGRWESNTGESIKISKNGLLLDGQHRLAAIIKSGVEVDMLVIEELENEIINVIDTGKPRSVNDVLIINRIPNAGTISPILNYIVSVEKNISLKTRGVTSTDILLKYRENPEKYDTLSKNVLALYYRFDRLVEPKLIGITIYHRGLEYADKLFSKDESDPKINKIRKALIRLKLSKADIYKKIDIIVNKK